jgi:hypothetical protein
MTDFFDGFPEIDEGDFNIFGWIGAMGAAKIVEDEKGYLKVRYWISAKNAEKLPEWSGPKPERNTVVEGYVTEASDDDLPF